MKPLILAVALVMLASTARADTTFFGNELGNLLASETVCGLKYRPEAIEALVRKRVGGDLVEFASRLSLLTSNAAFDLKSMSADARAAHCMEVKKTAKSYGFID
ncbi:signal recognition particle [Ancylobacter sp.]|uniref:signal recognition particle n=1 Tax=Ancylobacter sp. TaxID=1872567 RepID=UPI003D10269D